MCLGILEPLDVRRVEPAVRHAQKPRGAVVGDGAQRVEVASLVIEIVRGGAADVDGGLRPSPSPFHDHRALAAKRADHELVLVPGVDDFAAILVEIALRAADADAEVFAGVRHGAVVEVDRAAVEAGIFEIDATARADDQPLERRVIVIAFEVPQAAARDVHHARREAAGVGLRRPLRDAGTGLAADGLSFGDVQFPVTLLESDRERASKFLLTGLFFASNHRLFCLELLH